MSATQLHGVDFELKGSPRCIIQATYTVRIYIVQTYISYEHALDAPQCDQFKGKITL